jgi:serine/threonine protein kinase
MTSRAKLKWANAFTNNNRGFNGKNWANELLPNTDRLRHNKPMAHTANVWQKYLKSKHLDNLQPLSHGAWGKVFTTSWAKAKEYANVLKGGKAFVRTAAEPNASHSHVVVKVFTRRPNETDAEWASYLNMVNREVSIQRSVYRASMRHYGGRLAPAVFFAGVDKDGGFAIVCMEHVRGKTLASLVRDFTLLKRRPPHNLLLNVETAVVALWRLGVVHMDLHPNNIMVDPATAHVTLIDFASAARIPPTNRAAMETLLLSTKAGERYKIWNEPALKRLIPALRKQTKAAVPDMKAFHADWRMLEWLGRVVARPGAPSPSVPSPAVVGGGGGGGRIPSSFGKLDLPRLHRAINSRARRARGAVGAVRQIVNKPLRIRAVTSSSNSNGWKARTFGNASAWTGGLFGSSAGTSSGSSGGALGLPSVNLKSLRNSRSQRQRANAAAANSSIRASNRVPYSVLNDSSGLLGGSIAKPPNVAGVNAQSNAYISATEELNTNGNANPEFTSAAESQRKPSNAAAGGAAKNNNKLKIYESTVKTGLGLKNSAPQNKASLALEYNKRYTRQELETIFDHVKVRGNGNCLFEAIVLGAQPVLIPKNTKNNNKNNKERREVTDIVIQQIREYVSQKCANQSNVNDSVKGIYGEYCKSIANNPRAYGNASILDILSKLGIRFVVITSFDDNTFAATQRYPVSFNAANAKQKIQKTVYLLYIRGKTSASDHYDLLRIKSKKGVKESELKWSRKLLFR